MADAGDVEMTSAAGPSSFIAQAIQRTPSTEVHLAPDDAFDWEAYVANYTGRARLIRLIHIAKTAPQLRASAAQQAADVTKAITSDTQAYQQLAALCNAAPGNTQQYTLDDAWIKETTTSVQHEGEKLDLELRNYQNNLIKESIRMANRDLADYYRHCGLLQEALKCYQRTRDFCSTAEHVMDMCLSVIEVALEMQNYSVVSTFVNKAEAVLETYNPMASAASAGSGSRGGAGASTSTTGGSSSIAPPSKGASTSGADAIGALFRAGGGGDASAAAGSAAEGRSNVSAGGNSAEARAKAEVARIQARLHVAGGLAALGQGRFESAATSFLAAEPQYAASFAHLVSPGDVALYGILCSLAVYTRPSLKRLVVERASFRGFMEHEPHSRELLDAFWACDYKKALDLLTKWKSRHLLDPYLEPRLNTIRRFIIRRSLQQFLDPFTSVSLTRLADAFGWSLDETRAEVLNLVERGEANSPGGSSNSSAREWRLDFVEDRLVRLDKDERRALFEMTMKQATSTVSTAEKLAFRIELVKQGLTYKEPHPEHGQQRGGQQSQGGMMGMEHEASSPRYERRSARGEGRGKGRERRTADEAYEPMAGSSGGAGESQDSAAGGGDDGDAEM